MRTRAAAPVEGAQRVTIVVRPSRAVVQKASERVRFDHRVSAAPPPIHSLRSLMRPLRWSTQTIRLDVTEGWARRAILLLAIVTRLPEEIRYRNTRDLVVLTRCQARWLPSSDGRPRFSLEATVWITVWVSASRSASTSRSALAVAR